MTEVIRPEKFWTGQAGNDYIDRQPEQYMRASYTAMWAKILARTTDIETVLEVGASVGVNLMAIRRLIPGVQVAAIEPNREAAARLRQHGVPTMETPLQEWSPPHEPQPFDGADLVFTRGVLIHIPPEDLVPALQRIINASRRWIVLAEYYAPQSAELEYRGRTGLLWKNDYAGMALKMNPRLHLVDYGFIYRRDPMFSQDDLTWFLLEKR